MVTTHLASRRIGEHSISGPMFKCHTHWHQNLKDCEQTCEDTTGVAQSELKEMLPCNICFDGSKHISSKGANHWSSDLP